MVDLDHVAHTRAAYDATADLYAARIGTEISPAIEAPIDRAVLAAFVESVGPDARVVDAGCGTGRVAALLAAHGIDVVGVDLSPGMLAIARSTHPHIEFEQGSLTDLPLASASVDAAVCWYSIIHSPPAELGAIATELRRVLVPGAHLLVAFQAGDGEVVHRTEIEGREVSLTNHRHSPDSVAAALSAADLRVTARVWRDADPPRDTVAQAFLFARAGAGAGPADAGPHATGAGS